MSGAKIQHQCTTLAGELLAQVHVTLQPTEPREELPMRCLADLPASLQPQELPEDEAPEEEKACVGLSPFEHLPLRDSFGSRTEYDASDPAISVNGRIHDLYVEHFEGAMRVMEQNHQVLQRLVHEHRGQWSLRRFKDWLA
ncbi:unnamed protein product [Durusdinium trenchii]|uniref:Uncharacterized protein n=2 Tax=Durusdinium trenchii TaxID=1381693 RepID=A0ABP0HSW9_9DINO